MRRAPSRRIAALALAATALLCSALAVGEQSNERAVAFARSTSALLASVSFPELFDGNARQRLDSGFWSQVVVRLSVHRQGQDQPVSIAARTCRARFEVWEEVYEVQIEDHTGRVTRRESRQADAVALCTSLDRFPVASLSALEGGRCHLRVTAELNPVSPELLDSIRRWLRRPHGGHRRLDRGDSFFGSAVALFVNNRIGRADRALTFRSQVIEQ